MAAAPEPDDVRQGARAPLRLRVDYERMNSFFADYTKDLSKGGTFIKTTRPLPVGTRCHFAFTLPALSDPVMIEGEVSWIRTADDATASHSDAGMGVKFVFAGAAAQKQFEALVERLMEDSLGRDVAQGLLAR
jgi:type IV pilus assembly protein PilZ